MLLPAREPRRPLCHRGGQAQGQRPQVIGNARRLGSRLACKELMPVYTRYRELGGRYVTLGSDAHTSDAVAANFGAAEELAAMFGLGLVTFVERRMVPCTK